VNSGEGGVNSGEGGVNSGVSTPTCKSREIVRQTLEFENPARVARSFVPSDLAWGWVDIPNPHGAWRRVDGRQWRRVDEWGNVWGRVDDTSKGEIVRGALDDLDEVHTFALPDFDDPDYYATARKIFAALPDYWRVGTLHGLAFSVARKLRRLEQYLVDLLLEREKMPSSDGFCGLNKDMVSYPGLRIRGAHQCQSVNENENAAMKKNSILCPTNQSKSVFTLSQQHKAALCLNRKLIAIIWML
jgi:hypothetical protein